MACEWVAGLVVWQGVESGRELGMENGCSVAGAIEGGRCVRGLVCVRVCVFAEWSGCSVVLCLVLVLRCARVVVYVMGC